MKMGILKATKMSLESTPTLHQPDLPIYDFNTQDHSIGDKDDDITFVDETDTVTTFAKTQETIPFNLGKQEEITPPKRKSLLSVQDEEDFILDLQDDEFELQSKKLKHEASSTSLTYSTLSGIVKEPSQDLKPKERQKPTPAELLPSFLVRKNLGKTQENTLDPALRAKLDHKVSKWTGKVEKEDSNMNLVFIPSWICDKMKQLVAGKNLDESWLIEFHPGSIRFATRIGRWTGNVDTELNFQITLDVQGLSYYSPECANRFIVCRNQQMTKMFCSGLQSGGVVIRFTKTVSQPCYKLKLPVDHKDLSPWTQCEPKQYVPTLIEEYKIGWIFQTFGMIPSMHITAKSYLGNQEPSSKDEKTTRSSMEVDDVVPCFTGPLVESGKNNTLDDESKRYLHVSVPDIRSFIVNHLVQDWTPSLVSFWKHSLALVAKSFDTAQLATKSIFVVIEHTFHHHSTIILFENSSGIYTFALSSSIKEHKVTLKEILSKGREQIKLGTCVSIEELFKDANMNATAVKLNYMHTHAAIDRFVIKEGACLNFTPFVLEGKESGHVFFNWSNNQGISVHVSIPKLERT
jgi:hypothetical protein